MDTIVSHIYYLAKILCSCRLLYMYIGDQLLQKEHILVVDFGFSRFKLCGSVPEIEKIR